DLNRTADGSSHFGRLRRIVDAEPPAETASDERDVHLDALRRNSEKLPDFALQTLRVLRRRPDLAAAGWDSGGGILGRDEGMRLKGVAVGRRHTSRGSRERGVRVAIAPGDMARFRRGAVDISPDFFCRQAGARSFVPDDLERVPSSQRGPAV